MLAPLVIVRFARTTIERSSMRIRGLLTATLLLFFGAVPAEAAWHEARSRHFIIYSEQKPEELKNFAEELERFDKAVRILRTMQDPPLTDSGRLKIFVLRSQDAVAEMAGSPGSGVAGFYTARASGALAFVHRERSRSDFDLDARTVFFHEYLHHLMLQETNAALPAWFVEGSAELFATAKTKRDGSIEVGHVPNHRAYGLFNLSGFTIEEMVGAAPVNIRSDEWEQLYGRGWLLAHMLTFERSRAGQLTAYLSGIQKGVPALQSAKAAFGDLKTLDRELSKYMQRRSFSGMTVFAHALQIEPVTVRTLGKAESDVLPVVMRSERGVNNKTAPKVAGEARRAAAAHPNDAVVLAALAEAEHDAGNAAAAIAAADRAIAVRPDYLKAHIIRSRAAMTAAAAQGDKADWEAVRRTIARANRLDPDAAEPLMLFYESFLRQGKPPRKDAVDGLLYAQAIVPQDSSLRLLATQQLLRDGRVAAAQRLFGVIAYDPHAGTARDNLRKVMDAMIAGRGDEALTLLLHLDEEGEESAPKGDKSK